MIILAYILIFIALGVIAYGFKVRVGNLKLIPGYHPSSDEEIREDDLKRYVGRNLVLIGFVDLVIAVAMVLMGQDSWLIFLATVLFSLLIIYALGYVSKMFTIPKN